MAECKICGAKTEKAEMCLQCQAEVELLKQKILLGRNRPRKTTNRQFLTEYKAEFIGLEEEKECAIARNK